MASGRGTALGARVLTALIAGVTVGNIGGNLLPVLLTDYSSGLRLSHTVAGVLAAAQLLATAAVALLLARRAERPGRVRTARIGCLVAGAGFAGAGLAQAPAQLAVAQVVAGAGLGAVFAVSSAGLASTDDADRASTLTVFGSTVGTAILLPMVPAVNDIGGAGAGFAVVAGSCGVAYVLVGGLPDGGEACDAGLGSAQPGPGSAPGPVLLGAVALLAATDQGAWSYAAVLGEEHVHLSSSAVSWVLAVAGIGALAGITAASLASRRLGRAPALLGCLLLEAAAKWAVARGDSAAAYAVATVLWQACYLAVLMLLISAMAEIDPGGRWVAAGSGAVAVGTALGPPAVGKVLDVTSAPTLGVILAFATCIAAGPLLRVARAGATAPPSPPRTVSGPPSSSERQSS
ncbi:MFS transporter [Streptomyces lydicus]|uniref:MFS transporter n=1 Tax=Streptomyces lydicus TaxID=47763 RepID=A0A3S9YJ61_9ACTN|nr:MFS transporter [Streptomyces lydicus]